MGQCKGSMTDAKLLLECCLILVLNDTAKLPNKSKGYFTWPLKAPCDEADQAEFSNAGTVLLYYARIQKHRQRL